MENELVVTYEKDYIQVISNGEKTFEFSTQVWTKVAEECRKHNCHRVLGISYSSVPPDTQEGFAHAQLFADLNVLHGSRIAWVEQNEAALESIYFMETVTRNRGWNVRIFSAIPDAKTWLLGND